MLLWGLAAAVPIAIHLWSRRRYQEVSWAAMEYLLAAMRKNSRRIRVEQLLLLLVRVSILLLLGIALAEPFWPFVSSLGGAFSLGSNTHWVLVIDGSYSMDYQTEGKSRFDAARETASQIVAEAPQGDGFTLVLMSDPPVSVIADPAFAAEDVLDEIKTLELRHGGANLTATLAEVESIVAAAHDKHRRLEQTRVCLFSDMGRTTWDAVTTPEARASAGRLGDQASFALFDMGRSQAGNLAVVDLQLEEPLVTVGRDVALEAAVQNFGEEVLGLNVELYVDGQGAGKQLVDVAAEGRAAVRFNLRFDAPGDHDVEVRLVSDRLPIDNRRFLSVPVRESIRALCVEGSPGSARLVAYGLDPFQSQPPHVAWQIVSESAILERNLAEYDCIFLCNVARFGPDESAVLADFLEQGGGLVFFMGDRVQLQSYNEYLLGERRVLPARLEELAPAGQYFLDPLDYRHSLAAAFRGNDRSGMFTLPTFRYIRVGPIEGGAANTALGFSGGDAALVEEKLMGGRSLLVTTAASEVSMDRSVDPPLPWTILPTWRNYPALIQEMLPLAVSRRDERRNVTVGTPLRDAVDAAHRRLPLFLAAPSGETDARPIPAVRGRRVPVVTEGDASRWVFGDTYQSGVYEARFGNPVEAMRRYAVNVDTRESNLERFDTELLPSQFQTELPSSEAPAQQVASTRPPELFRPVLMCVLLLVLLETLLAWLFASTAYTRLRGWMFGVST